MAAAKGHLLLVAKLALAGGIIAYLVASGKIDGAALRSALRAPGALVLAAAIVGLHFAVAAGRWWLLIRSQEIDAPYGAVLRFNLIGMFFNTFMPGAVGGDAVKCWYVAAEAPAGKRVEAATSVFLDRAVGLASLVLLAVGAFAIDAVLGAGDAFSANVGRIIREHLGPAARLLAWGGAGAAALVAAGLVVRAAWPGACAAVRLPGAEIGRRVAFAFGRAALRPRLVVAGLLASWVSHCLTIAALVVIGRALGDELSLARYFVLVPIGLMVQAVPGPPGGVGVGEAAFEYLFGVAGSTLGAEVCAIWHALVIAWNLVGGIVYVAHRRAGAEAPALVESAVAAQPQP